MTRTQGCRKHIDKTAKVCHLKPETVKEIQRVLDFCEEHPQIEGLSTDAVKPLISIQDPKIKATAISHVEKLANRKTPTGGAYKKKVTKPMVEAIIKKVLPSETSPTESCAGNRPDSPPSPFMRSTVMQFSTSDRDRAALNMLPPSTQPLPAMKSQEQQRHDREESLDLRIDAVLDLFPSARHRQNIDRLMQDHPAYFRTKASVVSAALDMFVEKFRP